MLSYQTCCVQLCHHLFSFGFILLRYTAKENVLQENKGFSKEQGTSWVQEMRIQDRIVKGWRTVLCLAQATTTPGLNKMMASLERKALRKKWGKKKLFFLFWGRVKLFYYKMNFSFCL